MTKQASPINVSGPLKLVAKGYTPGTLASYAGLFVEGNNGGSSQFPVSQKFNTGSMPNDLVLALTAARSSSSGYADFGSGITIDQSVDDVISDYVAAHNT